MLAFKAVILKTASMFASVKDKLIKTQAKKKIIQKLILSSNKGTNLSGTHLEARDEERRI